MVFLSMEHLIIKLILYVINLYQFFISPWLGSVCRFSPTCSCYAREAFQQHGICIGIILVAYRLLRCQPFASGGYDPVPKSFKK